MKACSSPSSWTRKETKLALCTWGIGIPLFVVTVGLVCGTVNYLPSPLPSDTSDQVFQKRGMVWMINLSPTYINQMTFRAIKHVLHLVDEVGSRPAASWQNRDLTVKYLSQQLQKIKDSAKVLGKVQLGIKEITRSRGSQEQ